MTKWLNALSVALPEDLCWVQTVPLSKPWIWNLPEARAKSTCQARDKKEVSFGR